MKKKDSKFEYVDICMKNSNGYTKNCWFCNSPYAYRKCLQLSKVFVPAYHTLCVCVDVSFELWIRLSALLCHPVKHSLQRPFRQNVLSFWKLVIQHSLNWAHFALQCLGLPRTINCKPIPRRWSFFHLMKSLRWIFTWKISQKEKSNETNKIFWLCEVKWR